MVEPTVLIMFGAKNEESNLPCYLEQLDNLDYPQDKLRYAAVTADSEDDTVNMVVNWLKTKKDVYWRHVNLDHLPLRQRMFTSTNYIRHYATAKFPNVDPVDYVFHCDADIIKMPCEALNILISLDVDIVSPYVYLSDEHHPMNPFRGQKTFRDVWGYRFKYGPHPGLMFNPSIAEYYKRNYLKDDTIKADKEKHLIPMQSVGANPVLIKREVLDNMKLYDGLYATPGWCMEANHQGYDVWSYPLMECIHDWRKTFG